MRNNSWTVHKQISFQAIDMVQQKKIFTESEIFIDERIRRQSPRNYEVLG